MNTYFSEKKESEFRIFSNDFSLFERFSESLFPEIQRKYFDISEIKNHIPSRNILNFFERKIDYAFLESFDFEIHLQNFSYFSLEPYKSPLSPGIAHFHGKISKQKNLSVENIAFSLLPNTGWVFPESAYYKEILQRKYFCEIFWIPENTKWISLFCYPETLQFLEKQNFFERENKDFLFCFFGTQKHLPRKSLCLPFLNMYEYFSFLHHCEANIVRWENSVISALQAKKPFFWDIYKEKNNAHIGKIQDFANYLRSCWYPESLVQIQLDGNIFRQYISMKHEFFWK